MLVGFPGVGRSALLQRMSTNTFIATEHTKANETSPIIDVNNTKVQLLSPLIDNNVKIDLIANIAAMNGVIAVFDVTDYTSLIDVERWMVSSPVLTDLKVALFGTRTDEKSREVTSDKGKATAAKLNASYHEVSAKTGDGVRAAIERLVEAIGM